MRRIVALISYDGTNYCGWQNQLKIPTVQKQLESALEKITKKRINTVAAGRTDSGVHAFSLPVHFDFPNDRMSLKQIKLALFSCLPSDIRPIKLIEVTNEFHARFSAISKSYQYHIAKQRSVFNRLYQTYFKNCYIDLDKIKPVLKIFLGNHDYSAFSKPNKDIPNKICCVNDFTIKETKSSWIFEINGNRFLHHMVRRLVGTIVIGSNKGFNKEKFHKILKEKIKEQNLIFTAPPNGLFLKEVFYPREYGLN